MNILPTIGHVNPALSIARALQGAGHEVAFATAPGLAGHVRAAGLVHLNWGDDILRPGDRLAFAAQQKFERQFIDYINQKPDELLGHASQWRPDIVIHDWIGNSGRLVAKQLGIPSVALGIMIHPPPSLPFCDDLNSYPETGNATNYGDLVLNFYPPSLAWPLDPLPDGEHFIQPPLYDGEPGPLPAWLSELADSPTVYVTFGSVCSRLPGLFERIIEAAASMDELVVITTRDQRLRDELRFVPPNVRIAGYVRQSLIIPHCSAVISHGGFQVLMAALSEGVPVGCLYLPPESNWPGICDAERCQQVGAGLMSPPIRFTSDDPDAELDLPDPEFIHAMIKTLLTDPSYRVAAGRIQKEIWDLPDTNAAVTLMESLVSRWSRHLIS